MGAFGWGGAHRAIDTWHRVLCWDAWVLGIRIGGVMGWRWEYAFFQTCTPYAIGQKRSRT